MSLYNQSHPDPPETFLCILPLFNYLLSLHEHMIYADGFKRPLVTIQTFSSLREVIYNVFHTKRES